MAAMFAHHSTAFSCITQLLPGPPRPRASVGRVPNRLASATSPYLLQHAENPVDWWEWSEDAFAEARRRDLPGGAD